MTLMCEAEEWFKTRYTHLWEHSSWGGGGGGGGIDGSASAPLGRCLNLGSTPYVHSRDECFQAVPVFCRSSASVYSQCKPKNKKLGTVGLHGHKC